MAGPHLSLADLIIFGSLHRAIVSRSSAIPLCAQTSYIQIRYGRLHNAEHSPPSQLDVHVLHAQVRHLS